MQTIPRYVTSAAYQLERKNSYILMILVPMNLFKYFTVRLETSAQNSQLKTAKLYE
jgi:hypothetical protein